MSTEMELDYDFEIESFLAELERLSGGPCFRDVERVLEEREPLISNSLDVPAFVPDSRPMTPLPEMIPESMQPDSEELGYPGHTTPDHTATPQGQPWALRVHYHHLESPEPPEIPV
jgi:hypothetical protein